MKALSEKLGTLDAIFQQAAGIDESGLAEGDLNKAALIADALAALVAGELEFDRFAEDLTFDEADAPNPVSFADAGVLTSDEGFRFELPGGEVVYVTVQVQ